MYRNGEKIDRGPGHAFQNLKGGISKGSTSSRALSSATSSFPSYNSHRALTATLAFHLKRFESGHRTSSSWIRWSLSKPLSPPSARKRPNSQELVECTRSQDYVRSSAGEMVTDAANCSNIKLGLTNRHHILHIDGSELLGYWRSSLSEFLLLKDGTLVYDLIMASSKPSID